MKRPWLVVLTAALLSIAPCAAGVPSLTPVEEKGLSSASLALYRDAMKDLDRLRTDKGLEKLIGVQKGEPKHVGVRMLVGRLAMREYRAALDVRTAERWLKAAGVAYEEGAKILGDRRTVQALRCKRGLTEVRRKEGSVRQRFRQRAARGYERARERAREDREIAARRKTKSKRGAREKKRGRYLYLTQHGEHYHRSNCNQLRRSRIPVSLSSRELKVQRFIVNGADEQIGVVYEGKRYLPCQYCEPDIYYFGY